MDILITRCYFNPRTHVGCDLEMFVIRDLTVISIHAPMWGATRPSLKTWLTMLFQSTHPCGVRLRILRIFIITKKFQSTHPCGVRQAGGEISQETLMISIHAPMWGATVFVPKSFLDTLISIHAPMWGATGPVAKSVGMDVISIHAPMWGATQCLCRQDWFE